MDVKGRIEELLTDYGWTKYKLAQAADVSSSTIRNLFLRNNDPSLSTLTAICKGFNISLSEFFSVDCDTGLSEEQHKLLVQYNSLNESQRKILHELIQSWVKN